MTNALQWDGGPGHYEVHYLTLTDPATGTGVWIRQTMRAPGECAVWFVAMTPDGRRFARKQSLGLDRLVAGTDPFHLTTGEAVLDDQGMRGEVDGASWDLRWRAQDTPIEVVDPLLRRLRVARTVFTVPHPDLRISGAIRYGDHVLQLDDARGAQAHLWGSEHAQRWAWAHCNDFTTLAGEPVADTVFEGVSVFVDRLGRRELGPSTPLVARIRGRELAFTAPHHVRRTRSRFGLTGWRAEATGRRDRLVAEVTAPRQALAGVTYHDPDGTPAYCYNAEVASLRLHHWERTGRGAEGWALRESLVSAGRAHFEYAQRQTVPGVELLI